jgi:hypothetical protein
MRTRTTIRIEHLNIIMLSKLIINGFQDGDRLCGLVVRVSGYRSRGSGFDSRRYQIF